MAAALAPPAGTLEPSAQHLTTSLHPLTQTGG
jgi:hypothetical protein